MAYDRDIERQFDAVCAEEKDLKSRNMFGGVCYLLQGNMAFGIYRENLIVRLGSDEDAKKAVRADKAAPFDITGRAMKGWVMIPKLIADGTLYPPVRVLQEVPIQTGS